jgi:hypothetical protein
MKTSTATTCTSYPAVDENGKKLNDKFEHRRSKDITREWKQNLVCILPKRNNSRNTTSSKGRYAAGDVKHQHSNTVKVW